MGPDPADHQRLSSTCVPRSSVGPGRTRPNFDHVVMKDYRWGIFLAEREPRIARIGFGEHKGEPAWQRGSRGVPRGAAAG